MSHIERPLGKEGIVTETFHYDHDGTVHIERKADATAILEANKIQRNNQPMRYENETMNHVARIEITAAEAWCKGRGVKFGEFLSNPDHLTAFLNDPDNSLWRTRKGKI